MWLVLAFATGRAPPIMRSLPRIIVGAEIVGAEVAPPRSARAQHLSIERWRSRPRDRGRGEAKPVLHEAHRRFSAAPPAQRASGGSQTSKWRGQLADVIGGPHPSRVSTPEVPWHVTCYVTLARGLGRDLARGLGRDLGRDLAHDMARGLAHG